MLVEFTELVDRAHLSPVTSNMTVEAMPNDNLVSFDQDLRSNILSWFWFQLFSGELTLNLTFKIKLSRPIKDDMILRNMSENSQLITFDILRKKIIKVSSDLSSQWVHSPCGQDQGKVLRYLHHWGGPGDRQAGGMAGYKGEVLSDQILLEMTNL